MEETNIMTNDEVLSNYDDTQVDGTAYETEPNDNRNGLGLLMLGMGIGGAFVVGCKLVYDKGIKPMLEKHGDKNEGKVKAVKKEIIVGENDYVECDYEECENK